ncbi:DNA ligase D [Bacillus sp. FJAT-50079]|uniref:DNA ligase D n=1 Tax=Bacillus sp. FJAT-50079 TaxID=2833577 RepID=UPI001BCA290D|nr:DNA ligase D [Bacillus sp. FJAT-50079]MBS4209858.1 DNA ligase D [Bacillus sp. FJAT-50079]
MKPMLTTLTMELPTTNDWLYEIKYDGFRAILIWDHGQIILSSRNGKDLLPLFPELQIYLQEHVEQVKPYLPLTLDGELVILHNDFKANFQQIQVRGRMRSQAKIMNKAAIQPCTFLAFDLLRLNGQSLMPHPFIKRKEKLLQLFTDISFLLQPTKEAAARIQLIPTYDHLAKIKEIMKIYDSEGIVAKRKSSKWEEGKRTNNWLKYKNWKSITCFITGYDENNRYFHVGVYDGQQIKAIGLFTNGLDKETRKALLHIIQQNYVQRSESFFSIQPAICLELYFLELDGEQMREPYFHTLRLDLTPDQCTWTNLQVADASFPSIVPISNSEKLLWENGSVTKLDYLRYLRKASFAMLPYLTDRALTVIRAPHGVFGESFYQKNRPETSPSYVKGWLVDGIDYIVCNDLQTLIWLGNQLAIEFHIPFQTIQSQFVSEIVFDLDPPSRAEFYLAVKAALLLKEALDKLQLTSFVKLSGNKGMQVYIPLPERTFTWEETGLFTQLIATFLITADPSSFTTERLKKNRGKKLYIDFIQHRKGKTIIAPYSVRINNEGSVAAPLFWDEVNEQLHPEHFTIATVLDRLNERTDPFQQFFLCKAEQPFATIIAELQNQSNNH